MFLVYNNKIFIKTLKLFREVQGKKQKNINNASNIENLKKQIKASEISKYIDLYNININDFAEVYKILLKYDTNNGDRE